MYNEQAVKELIKKKFNEIAPQDKKAGAGIYSITAYAEISCYGPDAVTCFKTC